MSALKIKRTDGTWYSVEGQFKTEIVAALPTTGVYGILYLVPITGSAGHYSQHLWMNVGGTDQWIDVGGAGGTGTVTDVTVDGTSVVTSGVAVISLTGKEDTSNKTSTLDSSSTNTQYPGAKVVYDEIQEVREIAEGKTASYSVSSVTNPAFAVQDNYIDVSSFVDIESQTIIATNLHKGDVVNVIETSVPDRWVGSVANGVARLYQMETAKVPVTDVQVDGVSVVSNTIANLATVASSGSYNDLSNKPTIPSVGSGTVTIQQGTSTQTFNVNQSGDTTITLTDGKTYTNGTGIAISASNVISVTTEYTAEEKSWVDEQITTKYFTCGITSDTSSGSALTAPATVNYTLTSQYNGSNVDLTTTPTDWTRTATGTYTKSASVSSITGSALPTVTSGSASCTYNNCTKTAGASTQTFYKPAFIVFGNASALDPSTLATTAYQTYNNATQLTGSVSVTLSGSTNQSVHFVVPAYYPISVKQFGVSVIAGSASLSGVTMATKNIGEYVDFYTALVAPGTMVFDIS